MDAYKTVERIKSGKNLTDAEWIKIKEDIIEFLKNDPPEEERKLFVPFGWLEVVTMMCDGIKEK